MAVTSTGALFKALTFDNTSSRDYGVYITGQAVYNAPQRDVEMITIPARNGAFALDNGRFENIEVTYPAGIYADNEEDFAQAISDFRNFLCSKRGYCRLEDEYNPDEYRMAVYKSGLEVDPVQLKAGQFEIVFECKPQRWLKSGEEPIRTATEVDGNWSFLNEGEMSLAKLNVILPPSQVGIPSPTNECPIENITGFNLYVSDTLNGQPVSGTYQYDTTSNLGYFGYADILQNKVIDTHRKYTITPERFYDRIASHDVVYYNPPSGWVVEGDPWHICNLFSTIPSETEPYIFFGEVQYSATGTPITGAHIRNVTQIEGVTDITSFRAWVTEHNGVDIVVKMPDRLPFNIPDLDVELLSGQNYIWAEYNRSYTLDDVKATTECDVRIPSIHIYNPTNFDSSPLLKISGYGSVSIGEASCDINQVQIGEVYIATGSTQSINPYSYSFDTTMLNIGDTIVIEKSGGIDGAGTGTGPDAFYDNIGTLVDGSGGISSCTGYTGCSARIGVSGGLPRTGVAIYVKVPYMTFTYGTSATHTVTTVFYFTFQGGSRENHSVKWDVYYDGDSTITSTVTPLDSLPMSLARNRILWIYGYSTKHIGGDVYADCDIGEFYRIENGEILPINNNASFSSELPVLKTGYNEITYSDTITNIDVMPRWWKV